VLFFSCKVNFRVQLKTGHHKLHPSHGGLHLKCSSLPAINHCDRSLQSSDICATSFPPEVQIVRWEFPTHATTVLRTGWFTWNEPKMCSCRSRTDEQDVAVFIGHILCLMLNIMCQKWPQSSTRHFWRRRCMLSVVRLSIMPDFIRNVLFQSVTCACFVTEHLFLKIGHKKK
jgi:hypothetical protein